MTRHSGWIVLGALSALSACVTVPTGYAGVLLTPSGVQRAPLNEGTTFVGPLASAEPIDLRALERNEDLVGVAADGAPVQANASVVTWRVAPGEVVDFDRTAGPSPYEELIRPVVQAAVRRVLARYSAFELLDTSHVPEIERAVAQRAAAQLRPLHIELDGVAMRSIVVASAPLNAQIVSTAQLEQQVLAIPQRLALARAKAKERLVHARAEAAAHATIGPSLTPRVIEDIEAREWRDLLAAAHVSVVLQAGKPMSLEVEP